MAEASSLRACVPFDAFTAYHITTLPSPNWLPHGGAHSSAAFLLAPPLLPPTVATSSLALRGTTPAPGAPLSSPILALVGVGATAGWSINKSS